MYRLSDEQIEFISNDVTARGIDMENLRYNLVDHICCIIENEFDNSEPFETFYIKVVGRFYKTELREIQEETELHLTYKNYYVMKKTVIYSGAFTAVTFILGSIFKIMHWPGAAVLFVLAIVSASFLFLPLTYLLKSKEESNVSDKVAIGAGVLAFMLFSLGVLFRIQHWPGANIMWFSSLFIGVLVFIPLYFVNGIRKPEKKINTIVFTVLILLAAGLQFAMISVHPVQRQPMMRAKSIYQNEEILNRIMQNNTVMLSPAAQQIYTTCNEIKELIIINATGVFVSMKNVNLKDVEAKYIELPESTMGNSFVMNGAGWNLINRLKNEVTAYNSSMSPEKSLPLKSTILDAEMSRLYGYSNSIALVNMTQLQMLLLLNR